MLNTIFDILYHFLHPWLIALVIRQYKNDSIEKKMRLTSAFDLTVRNYRTIERKIELNVLSSIIQQIQSFNGQIETQLKF